VWFQPKPRVVFIQTTCGFQKEVFSMVLKHHLYMENSPATAGINCFCSYSVDPLPGNPRSSVTLDMDIDPLAGKFTASSS
jgi:hypothetical protein